MIRPPGPCGKIDEQRRDQPATDIKPMTRPDETDEEQYSTDDPRLTAPPGEKRLVKPADDEGGVNHLAQADEDGILRSADGCCLVDGEYEIDGGAS